jgi:Helix-turn-helix domain
MTETVVQAYRFALDPGPVQEADLRSHCGGQRFAFNWAWPGHGEPGAAQS